MRQSRQQIIPAQKKGNAIKPLSRSIAMAIALTASAPAFLAQDGKDVAHEAELPALIHI